MGKRKENVETITDMVIELQPEFSALNREIIKSTVDRHISYIIAEMAVYQKHQQMKEDKETTKIWEQLKGGGTQGGHYRIDC
jgi:hypothetical protein